MTGDMVEACPECDNPAVRTKTDKPGHRVNPEPLACDNCNAHFEEAVRRPRRGNTGRRGLAGRLEKADPGAVGRDS